MASITNNVEEKKSNVPMGNEEHVEKIHRIQTKDEKIIAIISSNKLNINEYYQMVLDSSCGAVSSFIGTTRDNFNGKEVVRLEYEAYIPLVHMN